MTVPHCLLCLHEQRGGHVDNGIRQRTFISANRQLPELIDRYRRSASDFRVLPEGHSIAMDWCEGFMEAVKLRPEKWEAYSQSNEGSKPN